ncbi:MAG: hypothetical protein AAF636_18180 [Pseudomonadota bacterium]
MSEAVTNSEIEGVLSSIRRLAGAGDKNSGYAGPYSGITHGIGSALVLTEDLRVDAPKVLQLRPEQSVPADPEDVSEKVVLGPTVPGESEPAHPRETSQDVQDLISKITALETAIANTVDEWEPDDSGRDAYAGTVLPAMSWGEGQRLDPTGVPFAQEPRPQPAASYELAETPAVFSHASRKAASVTETPLKEEAAQHADRDEGFAEEEVLDEAMLRALIAEVVREELRGEVGQRLSRNIRKLIRQEIQRALVTEELS